MLSILVYKYMKMIKHCVYYDDDAILVISQYVLCSFVCIAHSIVQRISLEKNVKSDYYR